MKNWIAITLILLTSSSIAGQNVILAVSMTQLLSVPEKFVGQKVVVKGYFPSNGYNLYLSKINYDIWDRASSLRLEDKSKMGFQSLPCTQGYIIVEGTFAYNDGYYIRDISYIKDVDANKCWVPGD